MPNMPFPRTLCIVCDGILLDARITTCMRLELQAGKCLNTWVPSTSILTFTQRSVLEIVNTTIHLDLYLLQPPDSFPFSGRCSHVIRICFVSPKDFLAPREILPRRNCAGVPKSWYISGLFSCYVHLCCKNLLLSTREGKLPTKKDKDHSNR